MKLYYQKERRRDCNRSTLPVFILEKYESILKTLENYEYFYNIINHRSKNANAFLVWLCNSLVQENIFKCQDQFTTKNIGMKFTEHK